MEPRRGAVADPPARHPRVAVPDALDLAALQQCAPATPRSRSASPKDSASATVSTVTSRRAAGALRRRRRWQDRSPHRRGRQAPRARPHPRPGADRSRRDIPQEMRTDTTKSTISTVTRVDRSLRTPPGWARRTSPSRSPDRCAGAAAAGRGGGTPCRLRGPRGADRRGRRRGAPRSWSTGWWVRHVTEPVGAGAYARARPRRDRRSAGRTAHARWSSAAPACTFARARGPGPAAAAADEECVSAGRRRWSRRPRRPARAAHARGPEVAARIRPTDHTVCAGAGAAGQGVSATRRRRRLDVGDAPPDPADRP